MVSVLIRGNPSNSGYSRHLPIGVRRKNLALAAFIKGEFSGVPFAPWLLAQMPTSRSLFQEYGVFSTWVGSMLLTALWVC